MEEPNGEPREEQAPQIDEALVEEWQRRWEELRTEDRALIEGLA